MIRLVWDVDYCNWINSVASLADVFYSSQKTVIISLNFKHSLVVFEQLSLSFIVICPHNQLFLL